MFGKRLLPETCCSDRRLKYLHDGPEGKTENKTGKRNKMEEIKGGISKKFLRKAMK